MASNLGETSLNMPLLDITVSHLSNQNIDSDEDLDEDEYCSETSLISSVILIQTKNFMGM